MNRSKTRTQPVLNRGKTAAASILALAAALAASAAADAAPPALAIVAGPVHLAAGDVEAASVLTPVRTDGAAPLYDFVAAEAGAMTPAVWRETLAEGVETFQDCAQRNACKALPAQWIAEASAGETLEARLEAVNTAVNASIAYASDGAGRDAWLTPDAAADAQGDCEDYALAKFWALSAAGVPSGAMQIILVRDHVARADHALLAVTTSRGVILLDNRTDRLLAPDDLDAVAPVAAVSLSGVWMYGLPRPAA